MKGGGIVVIQKWTWDVLCSFLRELFPENFDQKREFREKNFVNISGNHKIFTTEKCVESEMNEKVAQERET